MINDSARSSYRVIMKVEPAAILPRPLTVSISDIDLQFSLLIHTEMNIPTGLQIVADFSAESMEEAISRIRGLSNRALSLISFLTFTSHPTVLPWKCYDITPERKSGLFVQYEYNVPLEPVSTRKVDLDSLKRSGEIIASLPESHGKRMMRALHWYNIALQTKDVIDRFVALWISLESIETILRKHYNLAVEHTYCECGRKRTQINTGTRQLFRDNGYNDELYSSMRDLRVGIFHSHEELFSITPKAKVFVPQLQRILDSGLRMILKLSAREDSYPVDFSDPYPAYFMVSAKVEGPDLSTLDKNMTRIPAIDLDFQVDTKGLDRQGFRYYPRVTIEDGFSFTDFELALFSKEQVGKKVELKPLNDEKG